MAQVPATAKFTRLRRLGLAAWPGPEYLNQRDAGLQRSERAALVLRNCPASSPAEQVIFLIPLVGRHHVGDWDGTLARLHDTLAAFVRQGNPNWRALICGQDYSDSLPRDRRISFLHFTDPVQGNDKWRKLACLAAHLPALGVQSGFAMTFDADDIAHPDLVAEMLTRQSPGGYLAQQGFVYDKRAERIALAAPPSLAQPLRKPFWKLCGSCAALRFDLANGTPEIDLLREMSQHEHRMFPYIARLAGRRLTALSAPKVLYLLNHGENFGARRGRTGFKSRFVRRFHIDDDADIRASFHL